MPYQLVLAKGQKPISFLSLGEVAKLCGKSKESFKKLIQRGIMPDANFRSPKCKTKDGVAIEGYRLYSNDFLVPKLVAFVQKNISRGKLISIDQRVELIKLFESERDHFSN